MKEIAGQSTTSQTEQRVSRRRAAWRPPAPAYRRGYGKLFLDHILQAPQGCDFDFLRPAP